jgi:hypothetical protein
MARGHVAEIEGNSNLTTLYSEPNAALVVIVGAANLVVALSTDKSVTIAATVGVLEAIVIAVAVVAVTAIVIPIIILIVRIGA